MIFPVVNGFVGGLKAFKMTHVGGSLIYNRYVVWSYVDGVLIWR